jgi:Yip1 domain
MAEEHIAPLQSSMKISLWAVLRPSVGTYERIVRQSYLSSRAAFMWIFMSALIGGLLASLDPLLAPLVGQESFDTWLLLAIPIYALSVTLFWAIFIGCMTGVARLLKGSGTYIQLARSCAAFSSPLIIAASVLSSIPWNGVLSLCLYVYWLILYTVALQAVHQLSRVRSFGASLISLLLCGCALLGIVLIVTY